MRMISLLIAALFVSSTAPAFSRQTDAQPLQRMVATERAFAAATAEIGVRDGFLTFFSADAIQIRRDAQPMIVPAPQALASLPLPQLPIANQLMWEPFTGHVSADGTLGWLTGGYVRMNQAQRMVVGQGAYFSVWKLQPNGVWRVWLDEGIGLPQIWRDAAPFRVAPDPDAGTTGAPDETIAAAEAAIASGGADWRARLGAAVRLHADGQMPFAGREAVTASPRAGAATRYRLARSETAASGDLAVTIGAFDGTPASPGQKGSWVRVWKRDSGGRWRIVFQTENGG